GSTGDAHLNPVLCTDQGGAVVLACQSWLGQAAYGTSMFTCRGGKWTEGPYTDRKLNAGRNCWSQAVAAGPGKEMALAFDVYGEGDYDVMAKLVGQNPVLDMPVASSGRFEARPSLCYDAGGRLWIAYEEGPEQWGKDYGALAGEGEPLYSSRSVRVVCL